MKRTTILNKKNFNMKIKKFLQFQIPLTLLLPSKVVTSGAGIKRKIVMKRTKLSMNKGYKIQIEQSAAISNTVDITFCSS